jgi:MFS superfamily sulfate permease-like transporter
MDSRYAGMREASIALCGGLPAPQSGRMRIGKAVSTTHLGVDLLASVVVFLVALPLCMGIAIASGAPPAAGLITGIVGGLVVGAISGCPLQISGPAAGLAVIVFELIRKHGIEMLGPLVVLAGLIQLAAGALRAGQLFRSIAPAVVYGMLAGIGVLIFAAQFHVMVDDSPKANGIQNLISIPAAVVKAIRPEADASHHFAALLGVITLAVLIAWNKLAPKKLKWLPGALIAVVAPTLAAQFVSLPVRYVQLPDSLLSALRLPTPELFGRLLSLEMILAAVTLAFVASAETLLSATAVDQMHDGPRTRYNKELFSQGVGNVLSGLLGGLPMTGVIVRSATNVAAGAKTRASAMFHGLWLLLLVAALPGVLRLVPTASLAAILVYTGYKLVNPANVRRLLQYGGAPVAIYAATVIMIVATDLLTGIVAGLLLSVFKILAALTQMGVEVKSDPVHKRVDLYISGAATFIRLPKLVDALEALPADAQVYVHFHNLDYIDHACMDALSNFQKQRDGRNGSIVAVEWEELNNRYRRQNRFKLAPAA